MMAFIRIGKIITNLNCTNYFSRLRSQYLQKRIYSNVNESYEKNIPIKYSITKASKMSTEDTVNTSPNPAVLPIEKYVIVLSLAILLIYAAVRKENKIDEILGGTFRYEEDDEIKLLNALLHAKLRGLKTDDIEKRLKEVRERNK